MSDPRFVFVAHPIADNVEGNVKKVLAICKTIHSREIIPLFPLILHMNYLEAEGSEGMIRKSTIYSYFAAKKVDELWLYGEMICEEMRYEIELAHRFYVPIIPKTSDTQRLLTQFYKEEMLKALEKLKSHCRDVDVWFTVTDDFILLRRHGYPDEVNKFDRYGFTSFRNYVHWFGEKK